jgi:ketosteroid isomerase-like protein
MMMGKPRLSTSFAGRFAAAAVASALMCTTAAAAEGDTAGVLNANARFYAALNALFTGDVVPMQGIWSHADDVTYMGPTGGFDRGWNAVLKNWAGQAALKLGGRVQPADMQVTAGGTLAVVSDYEIGENTNADGKVVSIKLRATNLFRKEGGDWRMIGHHTDLLPYLAK